MSSWLRLEKSLQNKYYESKEAIFLEVYIAENSRIREETMRRVDWQGEPKQLLNSFLQSLLS